MKTLAPRFATVALLIFFLRLLPGNASAASVYWTNTAGGNWSVAANWNTGTVPGSGDDVFIVSNGTYTVTLDVSATVNGLTVGSTNGQTTLLGNGPTLTVNGAGLIDTNAVISLTGGALVGTGTLTVNGTANLGSVNVNPYIGGSGTLTINGTLNWTTGSLADNGVTTFATGSVVNLSGSQQKYISQRTVNNLGTVTWTGTGTVECDSSSTFNNQAGGLFDAQVDASFIDGGIGAASVFNNAGTLRKSAGTGMSIFHLAVNNTGTVQVQSGTLYLSGGGSSSGAYTVTAGTTLELGGSQTLSSAGSLSGAGSVYVASGTFTNFGTYNISGSTTLNGGAVTLNGPVVNLGSTVTVTDNYGLIIVPSVTINGTVNLGGINVNPYIGGSGTLTINGTLNWTTGTLTDNGVTTLAAGTVVNLSGSQQKYLSQRTVNNLGTVTWTGTGTVECDRGSTFNNQAGGLFDAQVDASFIDGGIGAASVFDNAGTLRKSAGTNTTTFRLAFNNTGTVQVQSGTLYFGSGGNSSGAYTVTAGTTLTFGGAQSFTPTASITGAGTFTVPSGTFTNAGTYNISGGTTIGQTIGSTGVVAIAMGTFIATNAPVLIGPTGGGVMTISGGNVTLGQVALGGTTTNASGELELSGGHLTIISNASANFIIVDGGDLDGSGGTIIIGEDHSAAFMVTGGNATNVGTMYVGYSPAFTGTFTQSGGTVIVNTNLIVGDCTSNSIGVASLSGGTLYVTNAAHTATLDVRQGSFLLSGGTLVVDILIVTNNGCGGTFNQTGGTLSYGQLFQVSGGSNATTNLVLNGGASLGVGAGSYGSPATLYVTNSAHTAMMNILNGTFVLGSGGTLVVDDLVLTNAGGYFVKNGGTLTARNIVLAPYLDADGDGQSNTNEIMAGTDPLDPNSLFQSLGAAQTNGADIQVSWTTEGGHRYVVQVATNTATGLSGFRDLSSVITVGGSGPGTTNYIHRGAATNQAGYYRVRLGP